MKIDCYGNIVGYDDDLWGEFGCNKDEDSNDENQDGGHYNDNDDDDDDDDEDDDDNDDDDDDQDSSYTLGKTSGKLEVLCCWMRRLDIGWVWSFFYNFV